MKMTITTLSNSMRYPKSSVIQHTHTQRECKQKKPKNDILYENFDFFFLIIYGWFKE